MKEVIRAKARTAPGHPPSGRQRSTRMGAALHRRVSKRLLTDVEAGFAIDALRR